MYIFVRVFHYWCTSVYVMCDSVYAALLRYHWQLSVASSLYVLLLMHVTVVFCWYCFGYGGCCLQPKMMWLHFDGWQHKGTMSSKPASRPLLRYKRTTSSKPASRPLLRYKGTTSSKPASRPLLRYKGTTSSKPASRPLLRYKGTMSTCPVNLFPDHC